MVSGHPATVSGGTLRRRLPRQVGCQAGLLAAALLLGAARVVALGPVAESPSRKAIAAPAQAAWSSPARRGRPEAGGSVAGAGALDARAIRALVRTGAGFGSTVVVPFTGQPVYFHVDYELIGTTAPTSAQVRALIDGAVHCAGEVQLFAGSGRQIHCTNAWVATPGAHTLSWEIDFDDALDESDESNNAAALAWTTPFPDVLAVRAYLRTGQGSGGELATPMVGQPVYFHVDYRLTGTTQSLPATVRATIDGVVSCVGPVTLRPGGTESIWCTGTWTATRGTHRLLWELDVSGDIAEDDENNNTTARTWTTTTNAADPNTVLILAPTVSGGASSAEARQAAALGFTVEIAAPAAWAAKSSDDFASYRAIILGDPRNVTNPSPLNAAIANQATWGRVINGNVLMVGSDPSDHVSADAFARSAIAFAAAEPGRTGAYVTLSDYYDGAPPQTPVPLLDVFGAGGFTVDGTAGEVCYNDAHIVAMHPALAGLTDDDLSGWSCSVHDAFDRWPADFQVLAIARNLGSAFTASDGTVGTPYILARGASSLGLALLPVAERARVARPHTVTATLLDTVTDEPIVGARLGFEVAGGPNLGAVGHCAPDTCETDTDGHVGFTYTGSTAQGRDTVLAYVDENGNGVPDIGEAQSTAAVIWYRQRLHYFALGDSVGSGHGLPGGSGRNAGTCQRSPEGYPFKLAKRLSGLPEYILGFDHPAILDLHAFVEPRHHLACTGATSCLRGRSDGIACRDHEERDAPLIELPHQVAAFTERTRRIGTDELILVTLTIGADDFHFAEELKTGENFCAAAAAYASWVEETSGDLQANLIETLIRLTAKPNVYLLLTDYPNPFNDSSAFFSLLRSNAAFGRACDRVHTECSGILPSKACLQARAGCARFELLGTSRACFDLTDADLHDRAEQALASAPGHSMGSAPHSLEEAIVNAVETVIGQDPLLSARIGYVSVRETFGNHESPRPNCGESDPVAAQTYIQHPSSPMPRELGANLESIVFFYNVILSSNGNDCIHPNPTGVSAYVGGDGVMQGVFDMARQLLP